MPAPTLRPFEPRDRDRLYSICLETGNEGSDASSLYTNPALLGEVYVGPYLAFEPTWARVIEHGGQVTGYLLCAPDTIAFVGSGGRVFAHATRGTASSVAPQTMTSSSTFTARRRPTPNSRSTFPRTFISTFCLPRRVSDSGVR